MPNKIGIFAGTFDPIHNGHLAFAEQVLKANHLDIVYFLPEQSPWRKAGQVKYNDRIKMAELAVADMPRLHVMGLPSQPRFTVEQTLPHLQKVFMDEDLYLLIGSDTFAYLSTWSSVDTLLEAMTIVVGLRHGAKQADFTEVIATLSHAVPNLKLIWTESPKAEISSSQLRKNLGANPYTPAPVVAYIKMHGLYKAVY